MALQSGDVQPAFIARGSPARLTPDLLQRRRRELRGVGPHFAAQRRRVEAQQLGRLWRGRTAPKEHCDSQQAEASRGLLAVTVRFLDGAGMTFVVDGATVGSALRSQLAQRLGIMDKRMTLIHGSGMLLADQTMAEQGIEDGTVLTVVMMQPICEGTEVHGWIAEGLNHLVEGQQLTDQQVRQEIAEMTNKKIALHDALAAGGLLRGRQ